MSECRLILGDCREVLPTLEGVDAVLTDPPYGGFDRWYGGGWQSGKCGRGKLWNNRQEWDVTPSPETLQAIISLAPKSILWGGNFFDRLPAQRGWLVWDKEADTTQGHAELAWTNLEIPIRTFRRSPLGVFGNAGKNEETKDHPTQKPTSLMRWCLKLLNLPEGSTVFDPYMGSGTTAIACMQMGLNFIGCEIDPTYHAIASRRIAVELSKGNLFAGASQ